MALECAIQEALDTLAKSSVKSDEDKEFDDSKQRRKSGLERIRTQIDDAQLEIAALSESLRSLDENRKEQMLIITEKKRVLEATTSALEAVREESKKKAEKNNKYRERRVAACSEMSKKDVAALETTKMKLRVCCALTGVLFNSSERSVSGGFVKNSATSQVKLFDVGGLPIKQATEKIWEAIEKTTPLN